MNPINTETRANLTNLSSRTIAHIQSKKIFNTNSSLQEQIHSLTPNQLNFFITTVMTSLSKEKEALSLIEKFGKLLKLAQLESAVKLDLPEFKTAVETADKLRPQAKHYFDLTNNRAPASASFIKYNKIRNFIITAFEGLLDAVGLTNILDSSDDSQAKSRKIAALMTLIPLICLVLVPLIGLPHGILGIATVVLILVLAGHFYPYIRPIPVLIAGTENWTQKYWDGELSCSKHPRLESADLASGLAPNQPILISGPKGIGKTELIKTFVQDIEQGKHPHLKGKRLFYVNTIGLTLAQLENIIKNTQGHKNDLIMVFDNLQSAEPTIREQLKIFQKDQSLFPFFIAISTEPNYIPHETKIKLSPTSSQNALAILQETSIKRPELLVESKALAAIIKNTYEKPSSDGSQFQTSLSLFSRCVQRTSKSQLSQTERRIDALRGQISAWTAKEVIQNESLLPSNPIQISPMQNELISLEKKLEIEKKEREFIFALKDELPKIKESIYQLALQLKPESSTKEQTSFLLLSHFFYPMIQKTLQDEASRHGFEIEITEALVNKIIEEDRPETKQGFSFSQLFKLLLSKISS